MKLKPHATARAFYKLLGLISTILYIWAIILVGIGFLYGFLAANESNSSLLIITVIYATGGVFLAIIGERIRSIRNGMVIKNDPEI